MANRTKFKIIGVRELEIKLKRFNNFLGSEYNKAMREVGEYGVKTFRSHIDSRKTKSGKGYGLTPDLKSDYKEIKRKKWGKVYPILRASDKMYNDIQYKTGIAKGAGRSKKYNLNWDFKTRRSSQIAGFHVEGIQTKRGIIVRNPWFFTSGERSWITTILKKHTKIALRKARLNRTRLNVGM